MKFSLTTLLLLSFIFKAESQTFTWDLGGEIYDTQTTEFPIEILGLPIILDTTNFGLESICLNLTHTWMGDLSVSLVSPDGTFVLLSSGIGGDTDFMTNTCFEQNSTTSINEGNSPYSGVFMPTGQLGVINNLQNPNGIWHLRITDNYGQDSGFLLDFSIRFGSNPASYFTLENSALPIVMLETNGLEIPNEPKINGSFKIIYNGEGLRNYVNQTNVHFEGSCGLETRGASSSTFPKKSYDLEIRDVNGLDLDTSILGFPSESDWVLSAQYTDKTLMRNMLSMHLLQSMGRYAPRFRPVDLFVNGAYQGVYIFMEKVKKGSNRVDISTLQTTENSGDDLTGGYIIKLDKDSGNSNLGWVSPFAPVPAGSPIVLDYNYPKGELITFTQQNYIKNYITDFETALSSPGFTDISLGYRPFVDYTSCLDAILISETSRSIDAYRKSFFMYKDKDSKGGKLVMAPIWDYDLTYGNADFCDGQLTEGWQYEFNYVCGSDYWINPFWFPRMMEDSLFQQDLQCRWKEIRERAFKTDSILFWIDEMANILNESQVSNYKVNPTMGSYIWPNSFVGENYQEEVAFLKTWIQTRMDWLDNNLPGDISFCQNTSIQEQKQLYFSVQPNPVKDVLTIHFDEKNKYKQVEILNLAGKIVLSSSLNLEDLSKNMNLEFLKLGIYFLRISTENTSEVVKIIKN